MAIESSVIFFPCKNIKETSKFYTEMVGLRLVQVQEGISECHIFDTGYGFIGFCQYADGRPIPSGSVGMCISFNCRDEFDVDAHYEMIKPKVLKLSALQKNTKIFLFIHVFSATQTVTPLNFRKFFSLLPTE